MSVSCGCIGDRTVVGLEFIPFTPHSLPPSPESWVEVGKEEGTAQESSSEEMTKLLADAVEEASGSKR